jgi:hypothetical protein
MMDRPPLDQLRNLAARLPEILRFGTSSWTYPGWKGLVYHRDYPKTGASAAMLAGYARFPLFRSRTGGPSGRPCAFACQRTSLKTEIPLSVAWRGGRW